VAFVGMNVQDRLEDGIRTAEETGVTYTLARDLNDQLYTSVGVFGMPTTVFIDADGIIIRQWTGILSGDELRQIIQTDLLS